MPRNRSTFVALALATAMLMGIASDACGEGGIRDGYMLIEGDIVVPENYFTARATYQTNPWPGGTIPYEFDANVSGTNQSRTLAAMAEWEARADITFVPRSGQANYVHIFSGTGNWSYVGMIGGRQDLSMYNWSWKYIIAHELAHTLSFWHEQSRPDRDQFVQIEWGNISSVCGDGTESCAFAFSLQPDAGTAGPYDFDSVMHYRDDAFTCCCLAHCRTITVLPPNESWQSLIGQRTHLSEWDGRGMGSVYGFTGVDCNVNYVRDSFDIQSGTSNDCNANGIPDECELSGNDCNGNGNPDECDLTGNDCNTNTVPDECELGANDCNSNGIPDECDLSENDCNGNVIPDECEFANVDCNSNGIRDGCDIEIGTSPDCNLTGVPDECEVPPIDPVGADCNTNNIPDDCDIAGGTSVDCDINGVPDECESPDCPANLGLVSVNGGGLRSSTTARSLIGTYGLIASTAQSGGVGIITSASYQLSDGFWFASLPGTPLGCGACQLHGDVFPFDIADPNGNPVGNCVVDIDDILTVLSAFSNVDPCAGFPDGVNTFPCNELCTAGTVDIDDILSGLAAFSGTYDCPHPCPGGACCFGDSSCQDWDGIGAGTTPTGGMSETTCGNVGGAYQGDGTTCGDVVCP